MPLTEKGQEIKGAMENQYGKEKGEQVFYASKNAGKITGVDGAKDEVGESMLPPTITLAELQAKNVQYWDQPGGETFSNDGTTPAEQGMKSARREDEMRELTQKVKEMRREGKAQAAAELEKKIIAYVQLKSDVPPK